MLMSCSIKLLLLSVAVVVLVVKSVKSILANLLHNDVNSGSMYVTITSLCVCTSVVVLGQNRSQPCQWLLMCLVLLAALLGSKVSSWQTSASSKHTLLTPQHQQTMCAVVNINFYSIYHIHNVQRKSNSVWLSTNKKLNEDWYTVPGTKVPLQFWLLLSHFLVFNNFYTTENRNEYSTYTCNLTT